MKTKLFALFTLMLFAGTAFSTVDPITVPVKKSKVVETEDSSKVEETKFEVTYRMEDDQIVVRLRGDFDPYSSVSITNNRGSEYQFTFVENGSSEIVFNVSDLKSGSYFVVLNTNQEIRMKRFLKK
jgi:hypothetical protein